MTIVAPIEYAFDQLKADVHSLLDEDPQLWTVGMLACRLVRWPWPDTKDVQCALEQLVAEGKSRWRPDKEIPLYPDHPLAPWPEAYRSRVRRAIATSLTSKGWGYDSRIESLPIEPEVERRLYQEERGIKRYVYADQLARTRPW